tara:strand:- start:872 stop:1420 length:549 start_codon:yes stop_codon:yes gene_type:complete
MTNYELVDFKEKINLDELFNRKRKVEENKIKVFQTILNRIHKKIKVTSRQKYDDQFCFYIVPEFLVGVPTYDVASCTSYIINKLRENGFFVKYTHPNLIFVSWKKWIPHYKRLEYKKQTGIKIDGFGNRVKEERKEEKKKNNTVVIKKNSNYKQINDYKSTGTLIYDKNLLNRIENKIILKK